MRELTKGIIMEWVEGTTAWWSAQELDKELRIESQGAKATRRQIIRRLVIDGTLEKHPHRENIYRLLRNDLMALDLDADPANIIPVNWPKDTAGQCFGLSHAKIYAKNVVVVAGEKSVGKSTYCINFVMENLDWSDGTITDIPHCIYHTNEMSSEELVSRLQYFDFVKWRNGNGKPKFLAIERFEQWESVVRQYPNSYHIIDYLDPGDDFYRVNGIIDGIRRYLGRGMALIAIQKKRSTGTRRDGTTYKIHVDYGVGGQFSEHRARVAIHLDRDGKQRQLYVKYCKAWRDSDPEGRRYNFDIINYGSRFANIREITTEFGEP